MALIGKFVDLAGNGSGGIWLGDLTEYFSAARVNELRQALFQASAGNFQRSVPIGGSKTRGLRFSGTIDAVDAVEFEIDNTDSLVSTSDNVVVPITVLVRVENAALAVTPLIYNVTLDEIAIVAGAAACVATDEDYSGSNQRQTLLLTPQTGINRYKLQFTATGAAYQFWGQGWRSLYI